MPTLHEVQSGFRRFIAGDESVDLVETIDADGFDPVSLLSIYRNNTLITLTRTLATTFPVVRQLVDARFFEYAAHAFICRNLPSAPCLAEYGAEFPGFLAWFPPAAGVVYLSDVARLEWTFSRAVRAEAEPAIALDAIVPVRSDPAEIRLRLRSGVHYFKSIYPVYRIWRTNQPGVDPGELHLSNEGEHLQIVRTDGLEVTFLPAASWRFRSAIAGGAGLGAAAEAALELDPLFDLPKALATMFEESIVVGFEGMTDA